MKADKLSRYGIFARPQHGKQSPKYWLTVSGNIKQNDQFPEWIIVKIEKADQFPLWIIATEREKGTLMTFNYEVEIHLNQRFLMYLEGTDLIKLLKYE